MHTTASPWMRKSEDNLQDLVLFPSRGFWDLTQVASLGRKHLHQLGHLTSSSRHILLANFSNIQGSEPAPPGPLKLASKKDTSRSASACFLHIQQPKHVVSSGTVLTLVLGTTKSIGNSQHCLGTSGTSLGEVAHPTLHRHWGVYALKISAHAHRALSLELLNCSCNA